MLSVISNVIHISSQVYLFLCIQWNIVSIKTETVMYRIWYPNCLVQIKHWGIASHFLVMNLIELSDHRFSYLCPIFFVFTVMLVSLSDIISISNILIYIVSFRKDSTMIRVKVLVKHLQNLKMSQWGLIWQRGLLIFGMPRCVPNHIY